MSLAVVMNPNDQHRDHVGEVADAIAQSLFVQNGAVGVGAASAATPTNARDAWASAGEAPVFQRPWR